MKKSIIMFMMVALLGLSTVACAENKNFEFSFDDTSLKDYNEIYPLSSGGKVYHISKDGATTNDGLSESKPKGLADISDLQLNPGDQILFKKGDVFEGKVTLNNLIGSRTNPITVSSYGEGKMPIIKFAGNVLTFSKCSNLVIRDLDIEVIGRDRAQGLSNAYFGILGEYNFVGDERYENIFIVNNVVRSGGVNKNVKGIAITSTEKDFATTPEEVVVNIYINGNTVKDIGRSGIYVSGWLTDEAHNGNNGKMNLYKNVHLDNNIVHDVGNIGMYISGGTNCTLNRNLVYNTGMYEIRQDGGEGVCGLMALCADTVDIMYNVTYNNRDAQTGYDAMGIDIDWNTTNINVQYNHTYGNKGGGIGTMACQNSFIRNNKMEDNACNTNMLGQIQASDFTARYAAVADDMHAVKNLSISENLIIGVPAGKSAFRARQSNGDSNWSGNSFESNRVVYNGDNVGGITFAFVDAEIPWKKFDSNRYYSNDTSIFKCFDYTLLADINNESGAMPYEYSTKFESWAKRDLNATYEKYNKKSPGKVKKGNVEKTADGYRITWGKSVENFWHYNIYAVGEGEETSYLNMLGETKADEFIFKPEHKGVYYIVVEPESNVGIIGESIKIKIEIK